MNKLLVIKMAAAAIVLLGTPQEGSSRGRHPQRVYRPAWSCPSSMYGAGYQAAPAYRRPAGRIAVGAYDNYFEPRTINVPLGTTIRWTNYGEHAHTVTSNDELFDSGDLAPGASYSVRFRRAGTFRYFCRYHTDDKMEGTIVVGSDRARGGYGGQQDGYGGQRDGYGGQRDGYGGQRSRAGASGY